MIRTFGNKITVGLFDGQRVKRLPHDIQQRAREKLKVIHAAVNINDLKKPPGNHLESLAGDRKGQWSIRINKQWRICFEWHSGNAFEVEITDYH